MVYRALTLAASADKRQKESIFYPHQAQMTSDVTPRGMEERGGRWGGGGGVNPAMMIPAGSHAGPGGYVENAVSGLSIYIQNVFSM